MPMLAAGGDHSRGATRVAASPIASTAMRPATTLTLGLLLLAILAAGLISLLRL
jgi:hypothetical protein